MTGANGNYQCPSCGAVVNIQAPHHPDFVECVVCEESIELVASEYWEVSEHD
jgi:transcription elongation factor Elf1